VREAHGELIAFLDDDTILAPRWIAGVDLILARKADAVVSRILPNWEAAPPRWLTELIINGRFSFLTLLDLGNEPRQIDPVFVWGASFFIRHSLVSELGGFHPDGMPPELLRYRGDGELGFFRKFRQQGYAAWYDPRSVAYHLVNRKRMTLDYLCQRSYNEGISLSYTQIREDHAFCANNLIVADRKKGRSSAYFICRAREMSSSDWLRSLKNRIEGIRRHLLPTRQEKIMNKLQSAHHAGWRFHQSAVKADPELLAYILRESYLD
jgi:GT2 family glycosyltransferase